MINKLSGENRYRWKWKRREKDRRIWKFENRCEISETVNARILFYIVQAGMTITTFWTTTSPSIHLSIIYTEQ